GPALLVFAAFASGMTVMLVALSIAAALLRNGLARGLKLMLPRMRWISGGLLLLAGAYLAYYWGRVEFGSPLTLAGDPVVGASTPYGARLQVLAGELGGWLVISGVAVVAGTVVASLWRARHRSAAGASPLRLHRGRS